MPRTVPALVCGLILLGAGCATAQTAGVRPFGALTKAVEQADAAARRELRIRWTATAPAAGGVADTSNTFAILQQTRSPLGLRKERHPEVSADQLVIVVQDASGRELDWRVIPNPRIVRAEVPGADGQLTGRVLEQDAVEFLLEIPDLPAAERIQIYRPIWNGKDYNLAPVAQLYIGSGR